MRTLAIDSATEACSVALFDGDDLIGHFHEIIGRGHAERLVPAIAAMPGRGRADRILVSLGPGSFTGVRIGLAAARALGLAWGAQVRGYPTLALVAAMARQMRGAVAVTVCMNGGHGEWFVGDFGADGLAQGETLSLSPAQAVQQHGRPGIVAGNRASEFAAQAADGAEAIDLLPDARHARLVPSALLTPDLAPLYGRAPDAALPGEAVVRK
ncbi:tRNA (adenosine(37)-N6)-threonylcarbamoyltransferase complex dimerization subunit type 1 TsaB [Alteraurantiacibacter palmitatis]|uniref:tRNA (Adenosine(37)-N6)-threonylcarbamoyltransferase complex dimerization subunit type 1 TsaB n=1 Tax=Alteraurantiacibacter palmitatis TaxID=2054628 RepID=A0ABV7E4K1_9SPHN